MKIHFGVVQDVLVQTSTNDWVGTTIIPKLLHFGTCPQTGAIEPTWLLTFKIFATQENYLIDVTYPLTKIKPKE